MRLKLSTPRECRGALSKICNMLINDQLEVKKANTLIFGINSVLGAIRTDELDRKVAELESVIQGDENDAEKG